MLKIYYLSEEPYPSQLFRKAHYIELNDFCTVLDEISKTYLSQHTGCLQDRPYNIRLSDIPLSVEATKMHVPKFREGIPNGCCFTMALITHVLAARMHIFTESVGSEKPR